MISNQASNPRSVALVMIGFIVGTVVGRIMRHFGTSNLTNDLVFSALVVLGVLVIFKQTRPKRSKQSGVEISN